MDAQGVFLAVVSRKDVIHWQLQARATDITLQQLIGDERGLSAHPDTLFSEIADYIFSEEASMVVVTNAESGKVAGVITRHDIFRVRYLAHRAESVKTRHLLLRRADR